MPRSTGISLLLLLLPALVVPTACERSVTAPTRPSSSACPAGSWLSAVQAYQGLDWGHDCQPCESLHFVVYSLRSSASAKQEMADLSEHALETLRKHLEFASDADMGVTRRLDVYAKDYPVDWGASAYSDGFVMDSIDSAMFSTRCRGDRGIYEAQIVHELSHIVQMRFNSLTEVWFIEGVSEYVSGPALGVPIVTASGAPILTSAQLTTWRGSGHVNPIGIVTVRDYVGSYWEYYPVFRLAIAYLFDDKGLGRSPSAIREMYLDMRGGKLFRAAFRDRIGLAVEDYRDHFFEWMYEYLGR